MTAGRLRSLLLITKGVPGASPCRVLLAPTSKTWSFAAHLPEASVPATPPDPAKREWRSLFARLEEAKLREREGQKRNGL